MHAPASVDARLSQEKVKHVYDAYARFYEQLLFPSEVILAKKA